eukprot:scaffold16793_cov149-Isochrysis_galbana.AAC.2
MQQQRPASVTAAPVADRGTASCCAPWSAPATRRPGPAMRRPHRPAARRRPHSSDHTASHVTGRSPLAPASAAAAQTLHGARPRPGPPVCLHLAHARAPLHHGNSPAHQAATSLRRACNCG